MKILVTLSWVASYNPPLRPERSSETVTNIVLLIFFFYQYVRDTGHLPIFLPALISCRNQNENIPHIRRKIYSLQSFYFQSFAYLFLRLYKYMLIYLILLFYVSYFDLFG